MKTTLNRKALGKAVEDHRNPRYWCDVNIFFAGHIASI
jgi:hypothetical protein